jgi:hypothetical protein
LTEAERPVRPAAFDPGVLLASGDGNCGRAHTCRQNGGAKRRADPCHAFHRCPLSRSALQYLAANSAASYSI